jgi:hypothetical protein
MFKIVWNVDNLAWATLICAISLPNIGLLKFHTKLNSHYHNSLWLLYGWKKKKKKKKKKTILIVVLRF